MDISNIFTLCSLDLDFLTPDFENFFSYSSELGLYGSIISVITGIIYMMYGWQIFRVMVVVGFSFIGFYLGTVIGDFFGWATVGGALLAVLFAIASLPLIRFATSIVIAVVSASLAIYLWQANSLPGKYTIACGVVGLILGGLCGYYILKFAVMSYTSLLGATIVLAGFYGFFGGVVKAQEVAEGTSINGNNIAPSVSILVIMTVIGLLIQAKSYGLADKPKTEDD